MYNKTVVDFILGLHDVLKVPQVHCYPLAINVTLELRSRVTIALGTFKTSCNP